MFKSSGGGSNLKTSTGAEKSVYPGELASSAQLAALADEYWQAAGLTVQNVRKGERASSSPFRLLAIHAIELYLNAFLLSKGVTAAQIRGMRHSLAQRTNLLDEHKLVLHKSTRKHLTSMSETREYLMSRYAPELPSPSQINQLQATLKEVRGKVRLHLAQKP